MGYPQLLRALDEETERQARETAEAARRDGAERVDAARREAVARRRAALEALERERAAALARCDASARLDAERARLAEARRLLDELRAEAAARLLGALDEPLALRLCAELCAELEGGAWELRVDPRFAAAVRAPVPVVAGSAGEIRAVAGGRSLDNGLAARLERAWPALEPELARALLEDRA
jgi:vacuolar-type H+-ATPase subunit E/Vma4